MTGGKAGDDASYEQFRLIEDERDYVRKVIEAYRASTEFHNGTYAGMHDISLEAIKWQREKVRL